MVEVGELDWRRFDVFPPFGTDHTINIRQVLHYLKPMLWNVEGAAS